MPSYAIAPANIPVDETTDLVDTCVLVARFSAEAERSDIALAYLDNTRPVVLVSVLVEAWGLLVGRDRRPDFGNELLEWASSPGNAILLEDATSELCRCQGLTHKLHIDLVDALLICHAAHITRECELVRPMRIVTFDTRDLSICWRFLQKGFRVYDLEGGYEFP